MEFWNNARRNQIILYDFPSVKQLINNVTIYLGFHNFPPSLVIIFSVVFTDCSGSLAFCLRKKITRKYNENFDFFYNGGYLTEICSMKQNHITIVWPTLNVNNGHITWRHNYSRAVILFMQWTQTKKSSNDEQLRRVNNN